MYGVRNVRFMARCTKSRHPNCLAVRDAVFVSSNRILSAWTTDMSIHGTRYCMSSRAVVPDGEIDGFEDRIRSVRTPRGVGMRDVMVLVQTD